MATKGGYQILDFKGISFSDDIGISIPNIYDTIKGTKSAILLSGIVYEGDELHDVFSFPEIDGHQFVFRINVHTGNYTIIVKDTDVVTITFVGV